MKTAPSIPQNKHKIVNAFSKTKPKIVVGINSLVSTVQQAYSNHFQMAYRFGRYYTKYDFALVNPPRMSIDRMRNLCAETALNIQAKYLLFIDDDVIMPLPFDFLDKLIALDADIAAADVLIRGYPFNHMYFRYNKSRTGLLALQKLPKGHQLGSLPVDAVGFSCCLIKVDLLRKLDKPYFITGVNNTEDIYFCMKARDKFPKCAITVDTSIQCGHVLWSEIIDSTNKKNYKQYYERQFGKPKPEDLDRGELYLHRTKRSLGIKEDA